MANDSVCFLEQTDFSLLLARGAAGSSPLRLEALQEVPLADAAALNAAAQTVFAGATTAVCALRPKLRALHLATVEEARRYPGLGGARQLATTSTVLNSLPPDWLAAVAARDGGAPGNAPWLASLTSAEGHAASTALLGSVQVKASRSVSATLNAAGAIATNITAPVWLLEIGELTSHALLISRDGVLAAGLVSLNLDRLAEAVQAELGLKFRGSAIKLFFNPVYDYTEVGPRIAARLAAAIKSDLTALRGANSAPIALACIGLPAAQQWFATQLAAALDLAAFAPESQSADITFASPELEATVSPAWFGFLRLAGAYRADAAAPWDCEWLKVDTIALPVAPKPVAPAPAPVFVPPPAPAAVVAPAPRPTPAAVAATPAPAAPKAAGPVMPAPFPLPDARPAAAARPVTPQPAATPAPRTAAPVTPAATPAPRAAFPTPAAAPAAAAPKAAPAKPVAPTPAPAKAATPAAPATAKPAAPVAAVSYAPKAAAPEKSGPAKKAPPPVPIPVNTLPMAEIPPSRPFFKSPAGLITLVVILVLGVGGYLFFDSQKKGRLQAEETARVNELRQAELAAKFRASEQKAQAEETARKKIEAEAAQKVAEAEAGRQRAETEARNSMAARLANARGVLVIASDPPGAMITVGSFAPRPSPATYTDLKIGKYLVSIALPLYDTAQHEFEVKEDATTDTGVIKLNKILGSLELITDPANVSYEVKPANSLIVLPDARRTGRTPAMISDLIPGDYTITFVRDGWMPQVENITIVRDAIVHVKGVFPNGIVKITSKPAGGVVTRDGVRLGITPLVLNDQFPGDANYLITLNGYAPEPLTGRIVGGQVLEFAPVLETYDHISKLSELDQQPKVLSTVQPKVPYEFRQARKSAKVNVELTVTRDGSTKDLVVQPGSDHTLSAPCLAAAAQWKFRPGSIHGRAANVRVVVPFSIEANE